ncbi:hypothetical protein PCASD_25561 [Puccinia coronata f. sp. avenae]|uniref:UNC-45/Cro1/She4 central domain-containing protein n=1 Tax=Puccinia coronata f. sp. avenae TaxID=200324 RepID=A0A2N5RZR8_9BASI|nr:hypothetical protein PCASD_25561 [Puccinia coronata f. sp. avenae]
MSEQQQQQPKPKPNKSEGDGGIQFILTQPAAKPNEESIREIFHDISSEKVAIRTTALSALAILLQHHPSSLLQVPLESLLQSTTIQHVCHGLAGLSAIFMIAPHEALVIIRSDGFLARLAESVVDLLALGTSSTTTTTTTTKQNRDLNHAFSEFIALSLNHKPVREILKSDWPGCLDWLNRISISTSTTISVPARCAATLALIKLRLTNELQENGVSLPALSHLCSIMLVAFLDTSCRPDNNTPIEGLALLSHYSSVRQILMKHSERFLKTTKALSTNQKNLITEDGSMKSDTSIAYGIATILAHLSAYKVVKTDEDRARDQLKKLAQRSATAGGGGGPPVSNEKPSGNSNDDDEDEEDIDDEVVFEWIQSSLKRNNDLMDTVGWLAKSESQQVKRTTGKVILNLVERQACRGLVLQSGGGRMLMKIIATLTVSNPNLKSTSSSSSSSSSEQPDPSKDSTQLTLDPSDLHIIQALAKILITTNPLLIFGPSPDSPVLLSTIKPLTCLFVDGSATLLQTFEALMALTNLSSLGDGEIAGRVAGCGRVLARLEECMIGVRTGENQMVRRAATELICNLSTTPLVLNSFGHHHHHHLGGQSEPSKAASHVSRLHILIALCSSDDTPTALAAGGALAILTEHSKDICQAILREEKLSASLSRIFRECIQEEEEEEVGGEGEGHKEGRIGLQFRLVSLMGNLSTARESNPQFFDTPTFLDSLNHLANTLRTRSNRGNKSQADDLIQLINLVIQSIQK